MSVSERRQAAARLQYTVTHESYLESLETFNQFNDSEIQAMADADAQALTLATHFVFSDEALEGCFAVPVFSTAAVMIDGSNLLGKINFFHRLIFNEFPKRGCLVNVIEAFSGKRGTFHKILILNGHLANSEAYIQAKYIKKLSRTPRFLPFTLETCRVTSTVEGTVCDATTAQWVNLAKPYLYAPRCEYWITVKTDYGGAGGSAEILESRKREAISIGIDALFEYYDKVREEEFLDIFKKNAYDFAKAIAWHIDPPPGAGLKVLVVIPAKYFDLIPKKTRRLSTFLEEKLPDHLVSVRFNTSKIQEEINNVVLFLYEYENDPKWKDLIGHYRGPMGYGNFSFAFEAERLSEFVLYLANFLRTNGFILRRQNNDFIEIGFNTDYRISYVLLDQGRGNIPLTVGSKYFSRNEPVSLMRTMALVANLDSINQDIKTKRNRIPLEEFMGKYIRPAPERETPGKGGPGKEPCIPDPMNPLKCCDFDLLGSDTAGQHFKTMGKNTAAKFKNLFNSENLKEDFLNYQESYLLTACGGSGPINLFSTIDSPRAPTGVDSINKLIDAAKDFHLHSDLDDDPKNTPSGAQVYEDKFSPIKKSSIKIIEDADIKKISPGLFECIKSEHEFINDPYLTDLVQRLAGKGAYGANGKFFSADDYKPPSWEEIGEIWNRVDIKGLIKEALSCTCKVLEQQGDRAIAQLEEVENAMQEIYGSPATAEGGRLVYPPGSGPIPDTTSNWWFSNDRPTIDTLKRGEVIEDPPAGSNAKSYLKSYSGANSPLQATTTLYAGTLAGKTPRGVDVIGADQTTMPVVAALSDALVRNIDPVHAQFAHEAVCQDLCKALPVLCSCIDLSLPDLDWPDFTIAGIFGYLVGLLVNILIEILLNILMSLLAKIIDDLLRCEFDKSDPSVQDNFNRILSDSVNFDIFQDPNSMQDISSQISSELIDMDLLRPYLADVPLVISAKEFCQLIRGEASGRTLNTLEDLMASQHAGLRAFIRTQNQIRQLFIVIGSRLSDTTICDQMIGLTNATHFSAIADHICDSAGIDEVRDRMRAGDSSSDQIADLLNGIRLCRQQRVLAVSDVARQLSNNPDEFFNNLIPPLVGGPGHDSLIPRDPPELRSMVDKTIDSIFHPVAMAFDKDATSFPESLIETKYAIPNEDTINAALNQGLQNSDIENLSSTQHAMAGFFNMVRNMVQAPDVSSFGTPGHPGSNSLSTIAMALETGEEVVGGGLQADLLNQDNFKFNPAYVKGKTATAFTMDMSPFSSFAYNTIDLVFNEGDNLLEFMPDAQGQPANQYAPGSPLARAMGAEPVEGKIKIIYSLPYSSYCFEWDKQRDFYEIQINNEVTLGARGIVADPDQEVLNTLSGPILNIAGEKKINQNLLPIVSSYEPKGYASLQQEIFASFMANAWETRLADTSITREGGDLFNYYLLNSFNNLTQEFLQSMAHTVAKSKYFDAAKLRKLALKGDTTCIPPKDSLANIDNITAIIREKYYNDSVLVGHEERFGMAVFEGVVYTIIRVYMLEFILSGLFPFSRFRVQDVIDEAIVKMAVKHLRDGLIREGKFSLKGQINGFGELKEFVKNAGVSERVLIKNLSKWKITFYEEFLRWCQLSILKRMEVMRSGQEYEHFFDKFLGKPVIVTLDPISQQERISVRYKEELSLISKFYFALRNWYGVYFEYTQNFNEPDTIEKRNEFRGLMSRHNDLVDYGVELGWQSAETAEFAKTNIAGIKMIDSLHEKLFQRLDAAVNYFASDSSGVPEQMQPENFIESRHDFLSLRIRSPRRGTRTGRIFTTIENFLNEQSLDFARHIPETFGGFFKWVDEVTRSYECECMVLSNDVASGEFSTGEVDPESGMVKMGYLEFLAREQLFAVKDEVEGYIGSEIEDINSLFLGNLNPHPFGGEGGINPIASDPLQRYFVKESINVPMDPMAVSNGRLPQELLEGTTLPFILEKYIKVVDYDSSFWDIDSARDLSVEYPESSFHRMSAAAKRKIHSKMAPGNRTIIRSSSSRAGNAVISDLTSVAADLNPNWVLSGGRRVYDKETILPISVWFEWLASIDYLDDQGASQSPIWEIDEENIARFKYENLFEDLKFGLRLVLVEKQDRKIESFAEDIEDSMQNYISRKYKSFFLKESTGLQGDEIKILSVPIIERERSIGAQGELLGMPGSLRANFSNISLPSFPELRKKSAVAFHHNGIYQSVYQWRSYIFKGRGKRSNGNLDLLYANMFGVSPNVASDADNIDFFLNQSTARSVQTSYDPSSLLAMMQELAAAAATANDACPNYERTYVGIISSAYSWLKPNYWSHLLNYVNLVNEGESPVEDIRYFDAEIRKVESQLFSENGYFKNRYGIDLNWQLPEDGSTYPFSYAKIFRETLTANDKIKAAFGREGAERLADVLRLELFIRTTDNFAWHGTNWNVDCWLASKDSMISIFEKYDSSISWYAPFAESLRGIKAHTASFHGSAERMYARGEVEDYYDLPAFIRKLHDLLEVAEPRIDSLIALIEDDFHRDLKEALTEIDQALASTQVQLGASGADLVLEAERMYMGPVGGTGFYHELLHDLIDSQDFSLLTEYIFPLKRFASLTSLYSTSKISGLSLYRDIFAETKLHAKMLFSAMASSFASDENGRQGWYRIDVPEAMRQGAFDPLPWWIALLQTDLSFNLPAFIMWMPRKILQIILSVPWFSTIVDPFCSVLAGWPWGGKDWTTCKDLLGRLPPHRDTDEDLPERKGQGYNCGTRDQIKGRERAAEEKLQRTAIPNSFAPKDDIDYPF